MTVEVKIAHRLGGFALDVEFTSEGRLVALFGPSGSGKTSIINAIAGLLRPKAGRVAIDGHVLLDTGSGIDVPAHRRGIGYVFQDARLFPHLSVAQNLKYGRWFTGRAGRYAEFGQIVGMLDIADLLDARPSRLSGGEKQRVAIGRALLQSPKLLLMDEPLASLDQARKAEIMPYIERLRDEMGTSIIYVSHSVAEVSRLASDVVVLAGGLVKAVGRTEDIIRELGTPGEPGQDGGGALLTMQITGYDQALDLTSLASPAGQARIPGEIGPKGEAVRLLIPARDVMLATAEPRALSALNVFRGRIIGIGRPDGASVDVQVQCGDGSDIIVARITRQSCAALGLEPGLSVFAIVKSVSAERPGPAPMA